MPKSLCRLLIKVNHAIVVIFEVANMPFNAIRDNKILAKISQFTVVHAVKMQLSYPLVFSSSYLCICKSNPILKRKEQNYIPNYLLDINKNTHNRELHHFKPSVIHYSKQ